VELWRIQLTGMKLNQTSPSYSKLFGRLDMLQLQCRVWSDRTVAVVYAPSVSGSLLLGPGNRDASDEALWRLNDALARLDDFHARMETSGRCALDLELAVEDFSSPNDRLIGLYPFNAARNRALALSSTEAVLLLDVDFLPSSSLPEEYASSSAYQEMMAQLAAGNALVLPAVETARNGSTGRAAAIEVASRDKYFAAGQLRRGKLVGFQLSQYRAGHWATNYPRWAVEQYPYPIEYEKGYEPYPLMARNQVPWYDERFRGYGHDKVVFFAHLYSLGVVFMVHPTALAVHVPHPKAATFYSTRAGAQWGRLMGLYRDVRKEVDKGKFVPVTSFPERCWRKGGTEE
jgi:hypothetical protein